MAKQKKITMPMTGAGILGIGSDIELEGIKVDPKVVFAVAVLFILLVKIMDKFL